jgi:hypothetical protein
MSRATGSIERLLLLVYEELRRLAAQAQEMPARQHRRSYEYSGLGPTSHSYIRIFRQ